MGFLTETELKQEIEKAKSYDYIRFSWPDMNGIARGKTTCARYADSFFVDGVAEFSGSLCMGPVGEVPFIERIHNSAYANSYFHPATRIIDLSPWAGLGKYRVGQVICETRWSDGSVLTPNSRSVVGRQLDRLDKMGYKLYSAFEVECFVYDAKTKELVFDSVEFGIDATFAKQTSWIFDIEKKLSSIGIDIGAMHTEYSPGQFEFCMIPKYGITTFDNIFVMKSAMKEILKPHGMEVTFMTKPFNNNEASSGFHFNHSLWDLDGKSVFFDSNKPNNMSDTLRYWVGGIMKHLIPLTFLCGSTPNCFRRLHNPWSPDKIDWGIEARFASVRVKNRSASGALVENRLPSSACNPYIVAAATIAAGLDGINNKIAPPPEGVLDTNPPLPGYNECMEALEKDEVLVKELGEEFIEWFIASKKEEWAKFKTHNLSEIIQEEIKKEQFEYLTIL